MSTAITIAGIIGSIAALIGVGNGLYMFFAKRHRRYREAHEDFLEKKRHVKDRNRDVQKRLDRESGRHASGSAS